MRRLPGTEGCPQELARRERSSGKPVRLGCLQSLPRPGQQSRRCGVTATPTGCSLSSRMLWSHDKQAWPLGLSPSKAGYLVRDCRPLILSKKPTPQDTWQSPERTGLRALIVTTQRASDFSSEPSLILDSDKPRRAHIKGPSSSTFSARSKVSLWVKF